MSDITGAGDLHTDLWRTKDGYRIKLKRNEWAKPGKYGRTIGDLGVAASLQGAFFISVCKDYLCSQYFEYHGRNIKYVKSVSHDELVAVFQNINDPTSLNAMYCHSDDAIFRTRKGLIYNLDISACDGSHRRPIFDVLERCFPGCDGAMKLLINQLCQPMTILSSDKKQRCVIEADGPCLYSGSTLTTLVNTITMFAIFHQLELYEAETPEEIMEAAYSIGYILGTPQLCVSPPDQQFLKHSPAGRSLAPLLNMGVVFRCLGVAKRDLPGGMKNIKQNALIFQGLLINGLLANVDAPFVRFLKQKWPTINANATMIDFVKDHILYEFESTHIVCTDEELFSRYYASIEDVRRLESRIRLATDADVIIDQLVNSCIEIDYGLGIPL